MASTRSGTARQRQGDPGASGPCARQLMLFGFPPPGHPFWTDETLAAMALRYPGLDLTPLRRGG